MPYFLSVMAPTPSPLSLFLSLYNAPNLYLSVSVFASKTLGLLNQYVYFPSCPSFFSQFVLRIRSDLLWQKRFAVLFLFELCLELFIQTMTNLGVCLLYGIESMEWMFPSYSIHSNVWVVYVFHICLSVFLFISIWKTKHDIV